MRFFQASWQTFSIMLKRWFFSLLLQAPDEFLQCLLVGSWSPWRSRAPIEPPCFLEHWETCVIHVIVSHIGENYVYKYVCTYMICMYICIYNIYILSATSFKQFYQVYPINLADVRSTPWPLEATRSTNEPMNPIIFTVKGAGVRFLDTLKPRFVCF